TTANRRTPSAAWPPAGSSMTSSSVAIPAARTANRIAAGAPAGGMGRDAAAHSDWLDEPGADGVLDQLRLAVQAELGHQAGAVVLHGLGAQAQQPGDSACAVAFGGQLQNFTLPRRQPLVRLTRR